MRKTLFTLICLIGWNVFACLNVHYSVDKSGNFHETEDYRKPFNVNFNLVEIEKQLIRLEQKLKEQKNHELLSDFAVYLLKGGKTEEALRIFQTLQFNYPEKYEYAANLGTAYELNGELDSALKYIQKGIELNPNSHGGSEWIHVKILETKIKLITQPNFFESNTVLGLTPDQEKDIKVCDQLLTQLHERIPFCPGPDTLMASLVTDLGDCYANCVSIEIAKGVYMIAKNYYGDTSSVLNEKINEMKKLSGQYSKLNTRIVEQGESIKESHFSDDKLLKDNNNPPHEIDWTKINTNSDSLLAIVNLIQVEYQTLVLPEPIDSTYFDAGAVEKTTEKPSVKLILIITTGLIVVGVGAFYNYRKRK